jgi:aryl-alcohol dehydrogenase-like predicted oxidoreductase
MEAYAPRNSEERTWRIIEAVREVAETRGDSMAQVALAWLVDRPAVSSVILGARTLEQLDDNLGAAGLHLSHDDTARLDEASAPVVDEYPYGDLGVEQRDRAP